MWFLKEKVMKNSDWGEFAFLLDGSSVILFIAFAIIFALGAWLWPYTINTWLVYADKSPVIEWWMGGLMGLVPGLGQSCIPVAFITFILMLFL